MLGSTKQDGDEEQRVLKWWSRIEAAQTDAWEQQMVQAYQDCSTTKEHAEQLLKPWLIRHNRLPLLPGTGRNPWRNLLAVGHRKL